VQGITLTRRYKGTAASGANQSRPIAVLRDEELVLLRAQAYFENGDITNGLLDLNSVRTTYGLAALTAAQVATLDQRRLAVLYEKRYSLFGEGIQQLVDLRAYSKLNATYFPLNASGQPVGTTEVFNQAFPIPKAEADARSNQLTPTCT
jgi:starch-binding outer membrane protein, SusD/RagB family